MWEEIFTPAFYITAASSLFIVGYLIINQVILRLVMMVGNFSYIAYYATAADTPLWGAIYGTVVMICANIVGLCALHLRNASFSIPGQHSDIYDLFTPARPGDFRALMRLGERRIVTRETVLTQENMPIDELFFIVKGAARVVKGGMAFSVPGPTFTGEVAYLLDRNSVATTIVPAGTEIITWKTETLRRVTKRKPRIKLALDAIISRDLAMKVSHAVPPPSQTYTIPNEKGPVHAPAPLHRKS